MMRVKSLTQIIKYLTSNQPPKNIPKPSPLQFNFNIPHKPQTSANSSNKSQVRITKVKRATDINKLIKKKKQGDQYKSHIQQAYQQQQQNIINQNRKTIRYHQSQYFKGQHLLQNIPLDPFYSYKLADFQRKVQMQKDRFKDFVGSYTNYDHKAQTKFKIADLYHQKQQKYQVQEFLRYIDQYPGSPKGPKPEDDLQYFMEYAYKKMPPVLATQLAGKTAQQSINQKNDINNLQENTFKLPKQANLSDVMNSNRSLEPPLQKDWKRDIQMQKMSNYPIFKQYEQIPEVPELQFTNYHQYMKDYMNWRNFKNYYVAKCGQDILQKQMTYLHKVESQNDPDPQNQFFVPRGSAPSLLRYYETLPKQIQNHPGLKDVCLGLQFHCPNIPYQEKEQALNLACTMALPLDKVSTRAMNDFIQKKKEYITPFMVDKIFTINPQYTWDIRDFFAEIKRQQLKGQSMIKQNEGSYPEPPQVHLQWQEGTANLPINYYENDDGFWDSIISQKLKRQDQAKPMMKVRKHFQH